jgi:MFS family permease
MIHDPSAYRFFGRFPVPLGFVVFFVQVGIGIILFAIFQEYVTRELGTGDAWPGILIGAYGAARFVGETPTGALSDQIERKLGMLLGFTGIIGAIALMSLVHHAYAFLACALLMGIGTAFLWPATYAISADLYPAERRGKVIGFLNTGQLLGFGAGALIGAGLVGPAPRSLFLIASLAVAVAFASALLGIPSYRTQRLFGRIRHEQRPRLRAVMSPQLTALSALILVATISLYMIVPAIRPLGEDQIGVTFFELTVALIPGVVLGGLLYVPSGQLADRFGRILPFFFGQLLLIAGMFTAAQTQSLPVAAVAGWTIFAGNVLAVPAYNAAIMDLAPASHRGTLIGLTVALSGLGLAIGPVLGGIISQAASPAAVFRTAAIVSTFTGCAIVLYGRRFAMGRNLPAPEELRAEAPP